ncbi:PBP1 and LysM peptidoglycan-binding domain-containing protein [Marinilabilia rubra]|uniref:Peptidoglycan-binding protein n=1 Tax=Marinilabilia rubra TaxID=2162893 RepID=A0A2U2BA80_9BACT|nr:LysM peptidoglycan-binding domain-containing protein [Marinilabilia rubra]PWD99979.1 peptidoglycan-binding protein [Marinilabilia rubra]
MHKNSFQKIRLFLIGVLAFGFVAVSLAQDEPLGRRIVIDGDEYFLHVVEPGQGFYGIGRKYNVTQKEILEANPDIGEELKSGQVIRIPVIEGRNTSFEEINKTGNFILHTVEKGQTIWYISRKYGVDVENIIKNNPGSDEKLIVGSIIKVPVKKPRIETDFPGTDKDFMLYTVKPGNTLYSLSRRFNVSVGEIVKYNPALRNGVLKIGSVVRIPQEEEMARASLSEPTSDKMGMIQGEEFIYHEIKPGQTLYSIGKRYQTEVSEIRKLNPEISISELKPGYMLRIPKVDNRKQTAKQQRTREDLFQTHRVKRRETLFSISRRYNVDMETIRKVNQGIDFSDLRKGIELKIPKDEWFVENYPGSPDEKDLKDKTAFERTEQAAYETADSMCLNKSGLGRMRPVRVALLLPFALDETEEANILEKIEDRDTIRTVRKNRIVARRSKVFAEFYEGVLLSLDQLKKENVSVDLSVFDIAPDKESLKMVLKTNSEIKNMDLIIGPARSENLEIVSEFAFKHKIKLVYPLSNVNPELDRNPYVFQINTPDTLVFDKMANEIVRQAGDFNLIAIVPETEDPYAGAFLEKLRKKVFFNEFAMKKEIHYKEYRMSGKADKNNLEALLDPERKNYVVVPTNEEATLSKIVPTLAGIVEQDRTDIRLFGMTEWLRAQSVDPEDMFTLKAQIFSFFAFDYSSAQTNRFIKKYRKWYHTEPQAVSSYFQNSSSSSGYSRYGAWGYDVSYYFIAALARRGENFEYCPDPLDLSPVQFNFCFKRISNWGGFYNEGIFMLKFLPGYEVKRLPVFSMQPLMPLEEIE